MRHLLLACLLALPFQSHPAGPAPAPTAEEFGRRFWQALKLDYTIQRQFTYLERRREVKVSKLGKVTVGPLRTFEVVPGAQPGGTYKRLIEIDGKPLGRDELAKRDAEHARDIREAAERLRQESPRDRADRERTADEEQQRRSDMLADARDVFEAVAIRHDVIDGVAVFVADVRPRQDARVRTREGRWMKRFAGQLWVSQDEFQIVRLDMRAFDDINIGWGVIGHIERNTRVFYARRRFENVWLPAEITYHATGRTLLFRGFEVAITTTFSDYRRR